VSDVRPWGHYIAVIDPPTERNDGTAGGIIIPEGFGLHTLDKGIVLAVGEAVAEANSKPEGFGVGSAVWFLHEDAMELGGRDNMKFVRSGNLIAWEPSPVEVPA
jgi:co-chaperonin GroES (HSP10)